MSHSNPKQNDPFEDADETSHRALPAGQNDSFSASSPASPPLRGEIFDVILGENGEIEPALVPRRAPGAGWMLAGLAALFCAYTAGAYVGQKSKAPAPVGPFLTKPEAKRALRVQVVGLVKKPGVYTLESGARIEDAVHKAGGALAGADLNALNLADWAADGSKIEVPAKRATKILPTPTPQVIIKEVFVTPPQNAPETASEAAPTQPSRSSATTETASTFLAQPTDKTKFNAKVPRANTKSGGKSSVAALDFLRKNPVDLNHASAEQLALLPGVGPKMAERILAYRQENGGFKSLADLDNVKGIGEKRLETLKPLVKF